jgi:hypothetical protein
VEQIEFRRPQRRIGIEIFQRPNVPELSAELKNSEKFRWLHVGMLDECAEVSLERRHPQWKISSPESFLGERLE